MKKLLPFLLLMLLLSSCHTKSVFVWTVSDVFGLALLAIAVLVIIGMFIYYLVLSVFKRKNRRFR